MGVLFILVLEKWGVTTLEILKRGSSLSFKVISTQSLNPLNLTKVKPKVNLFTLSHRGSDNTPLQIMFK